MTASRLSRTGLALTAAIGLSLLLAACSSGPGDSVKPTVQVTSASSSATPDYNLTGVAIDDVGVTEVSYTLGGAAAQPVVLTDGSFSVALTLAPGTNDIAVSARDAAGNSGSDSLTVTYNAPPSGVVTSQDIAARGDSITINGSGFGTSGTVRVGDAEATASSWSDSEISLTIPADAPGGPQTIAVESPHGSSSVDMFIGVDFAAGTLEDLEALGLPTGTAVRLGTGTFSQTSSLVTLDNLSLYGQGIGETIVDSGPAPQMLSWNANGDQTLVMADLELRTDVFLIGPNTPGSVAELEASMARMSGDPELLLDTLAGAGELGTLAATTGSLTMRNLLIEEHLGGMGLITVNMVTMGFYNGSVHLENVEHDAAGSIMALFAGADVTIVDSELDNAAHVVLAFSGDVTITSSVLKGGAAASGIMGVGGMLYGNRLTVTDSVFRTYGEGYYLAPVSAVVGVGLPIGVGTANVSGSTFRILDPDPPAATSAGSLMIAGYSGLSTFHDNTFVVHRELMLAALGGNVDFANNTVNMGLDPAIPLSPIVFRRGELSSFIDFRNNTVNWAGGGGLEFPGLGTQLIDSNSFTGQSGVAITMDQDSVSLPVDLTLSNNTFSGFESALDITLDGVAGYPVELNVTGNDFDFPIDAAGKVATLTDVVEATIDVDGNRWGGETNVTLLNSYIVRSGSTPADMVEITSVLP